jgi:RNA polymerase sigma factor (sigma-70 family)
MPFDPARLDEALAAARLGDPVALDLVARATHACALKVARRRIGHGRRWAESGDIVQQVCLEMIELVRHSDASFTWGAFLRDTYSRVDHRIVDLLRRQGREGRESNSPVPLPELTADENESLAGPDREWIRELVFALPEPFATIVALRAMEGCSFRFIAEFLDFPQKTVRDDYIRARKSLADVLARQGLA